MAVRQVGALVVAVVLKYVEGMKKSTTEVIKGTFYIYELMFELC